MNVSFPGGRPFALLLSGNLFSKIGDGIHEFVFIITVLKITGNGVAEAAVIYFFRFIPYVVLGPIGGALSDRMSRRALMVGGDAGRALVSVAFCLLLLRNEATVSTLAAVGVFMTAFRTLFQPAFQAAIPSLVGTGSLPQANGAAHIASEIGALAGPALGAVALTLVADTRQVLMLDAGIYLVSAACIAVVRLPTAPERPTARVQTLTPGSLYRDFGRSLHAIWRKPQLSTAIFYSAMCILFVGAALRILIPAMMKDAGYADSALGYAMSSLALGAIVGAVACGKLVRDAGTRRLMIYWGLYGVAMALLPLCLGGYAAILAGCFALGALGAFVDVLLPTNIQTLSDPHTVGSNFGLFSTLANTGEALSGGFAGLLVLFFPAAVSVTLIGLLTAIVACVGERRSVAQHE